MELSLYSSAADNLFPNLVALQDDLLTALPTVLVCPLKAEMEMTALRVEVALSGQILIAIPELVRPIRRGGLRFMGKLDAETSHEIMERLKMLLAQ